MAEFPLSPGVVTSEIDRSIRQPTVASGSVGALVGRFDWGPAMIPTLVESTTELINEFGKPTDKNYIEWFNAYNFLQYGQELNVVRIVENETSNNATFLGTTSVLIPNDDQYMNYLILEEGGLRDSAAGGSDPNIGLDTVYGPWIARFPGDLGNSLRVDMCQADAMSESVGLRDAANTTDYINTAEFTQIEDNYYSVMFKHDDGAGTVTDKHFMGTASSYFADRLDVIDQDKVLSFIHDNGVDDPYDVNMLITGVNGDGSINAYVNQGSNGRFAGATFSLTWGAGDELKAVTVRERSKYKEYSYGAIRNSPNNLLGSVWFNNNSDRLYGVNTVFERQVSVGDKVTVRGQKQTVIEVISNTELRLAAVLVTRVAQTAPVGWTREWIHANLFNGAPRTSTHARTVNNNPGGHYNDQIHVVVTDDGGDITGTVGSVLESYGFLSVAKDGKDEFGAPTYYPSRLNVTSEWVNWGGHPLVGIVADSNWGSKTYGTTFTTYHKRITAGVYDYMAGRLSGGSNGDPVQDDDVLAAIDTMASKEAAEVDFFITGWTYQAGGEIDYRLAISRMIQVAEDRKDCVVCVSGDYGQIARGMPTEELIVDSFINWRNGVYDSSYGFMDANFKYQYDSFNDTYRWLPLSGDIAGLMAQTDEGFAPWYSPAGYSRGQIKNVIKLAFNPSTSGRDDLYLNQMNPVISVRGEGTFLFGDKTLQRTASAFDRINVRRLFITLKDFVLVQARQKLFEFNSPSTRADFKRVIDAYLDTVVTNQGISEFRVICDESNNTADLIEQNRFVADIYVRPNYVINFIKLNFIAVGQTVDFDDLIDATA